MEMFYSCINIKESVYSPTALVIFRLSAFVCSIQTVSLRISDTFICIFLRFL